jgi:hypothetical protein
MPTDPRIRPRAATPVAVAAALLAAGCSVHHQPARRPTTHDTTGAGTGSPTSGRRVVIPTESPGPAVDDRSPNPGLPAAAVWPAR